MWAVGLLTLPIAYNVWDALCICQSLSELVQPVNNLSRRQGMRSSTVQQRQIYCSENKN